MLPCEVVFFQVKFLNTTQTTMHTRRNFKIHNKQSLHREENITSSTQHHREKAGHHKVRGAKEDTCEPNCRNCHSNKAVHMQGRTYIILQATALFVAPHSNDSTSNSSNFIAYTNDSIVCILYLNLNILT